MTCMPAGNTCKNINELLKRSTWNNLGQQVEASTCITINAQNMTQHVTVVAKSCFVRIVLYCE